MTRQSWWLKDPQRLLQEEEALRVAGIPFERDHVAETGGLLAYNVTVADASGAPVTLRAEYPATFPYFKPQVTGPDLGFAHHYNKVTGEMCLLASGRGAWLPSNTLAWLLDEQWRKLLAANSGDGRDDGGDLLETDQAEPVSVYIETAPEHVILFDSAVRLPDDAVSGTATVEIARPEPLLGVVHQGSADGHGEIYTGRTLPAGMAGSISVPWVRLTKVPTELTAEAFWQAALSVNPALNSLKGGLWATAAKPGHRPGQSNGNGPGMQLVLIAFAEETRRRVLGTGWVAIKRHRSNSKTKPTRPQLIRVTQAGPSDLAKRAPDLVSLTTKRVLVVGAGGLGSSILTELGRTGLAEVAVVDGDFVDFAAAVRFPSGFRFAGMRKVNALVQLLRESQPFTKFNGLDMSVGAVHAAGAGQMDLLLDKINEVDLIVDATADVSVQHWLADTARASGTAYMHAEASRGVWGGLIGIYPAGSDVCWACVQHYLEDGSIPALLETAMPDVQPAGCAEPTYTGCGFDLAVIASQTVRSAVALLTGPDKYGAIPGNVQTVALRDNAGQPIVPNWTPYELGRHPQCQNHP